MRWLFSYKRRLLHQTGRIAVKNAIVDQPACSDSDVWDMMCWWWCCGTFYVDHDIVLTYGMVCRIKIVVYQGACHCFTLATA